MSAPEGLRLLADWFDAQDAKNGNPRHEVQDDLRRWADEYECMRDAAITAERLAALKECEGK